jgi:4-hydroxybenzoate polyprenyltransferase
MTLKERLHLYEKLMRLDKPIGVLLLLWPTLWGLWISSYGRPNWVILWIFVLGTILMRSAGCVINDYVDRDIDRQVERTRGRPLASGQVNAKEALLLATVLALLAFSLILTLDRLVIILSVPALLIAATYPYTKRFFAVPQVYLGIAFGFGIPMAYAANVGAVPLVAWVLMLANMFWAVAYDTEYAMVDRSDDIKVGIKTSAITFGKYDVLAVMFCYATMLGILAGVGLRFKFGVLYYLGLLAAAGVMGYHYLLIKDRERDKCFKAFLHNNWLGAAVFAGIALDLHYRY